MSGLWRRMCDAPPRTRWADEAFFIYAMLVAGKRADTMKDRLARLLTDCVKAGVTPRALIRGLADDANLGSTLRLLRTGQYGRLTRGLEEWAVLGPDMAGDVRVEALEEIHGCGPKTARFWMLYRRPGTRVAVLDTHVLKFLSDCRCTLVPKGTPGAGATYRRLEREVLIRCDYLGVTPAELDDYIWRHFARGEDTGYTAIISLLRTGELA